MINHRLDGNFECARAGWGGILVFYARQDSNGTLPDTITIRVKNASTSAAQTAAQGVSGAAQSAASGVGKGVKQGVYSVRVWAAPWLENAADYTTTTVAPKVSSALRTSAQQVRPEDPKKSRSALTWSLLATAVLATAGAVAALVRYRSRAAITTGGEEFGNPAGTAATGAEGASQTPAGATAESADVGVNGRVSTSGW